MKLTKTSFMRSFFFTLFRYGLRTSANFTFVEGAESPRKNFVTIWATSHIRPILSNSHLSTSLLFHIISYNFIIVFKLFLTFSYHFLMHCNFSYQLIMANLPEKWREKTRKKKKSQPVREWCPLLWEIERKMEMTRKDKNAGTDWNAVKSSEFSW